MFPNYQLLLNTDRHYNVELYVTTTTIPETVTISKLRAGEDFVLSWGDGTSQTITAGTADTIGHSYATAGEYKIRFSIETMIDMRIFSLGLMGNMSSWRIPATMEILYMYSNNMSGVPDFSESAAISSFQMQNNTMSQSDVDGILMGVYRNRADITDLTPNLDIGGSNAAPSGTYADENPASTGKGYAYKLVNDPDAEGFNVWTVTFTA